MSSNNTPKWRRSSFCQADGCVEVAQVDTALGTQVWVRNSRDGDRGPVLKFTGDDWSAFHAGMLAASGGFVPVGAS